MNCARAIATLAVCCCLTSGMAFGQIIDEVDHASAKSGGWTRPTGGSSSKTGGGWSRVPSSGNGGSSYVPATGTRPSTYVRPGTTAQPQQQRATIRPNAPPKMSTGVAANSKPRRTLAQNDPPEQVVLGPAGLVVDKDDVIDENEKAKQPVDVTGGDVGPDPSGSDPTVLPSGQDEKKTPAQEMTEAATAAALAKAEEASQAASAEAASAPASEPANQPGKEPALPLGQEATEPLGQEAAEPLGQEAADPTTADSVVLPPTGGSANTGGGSASNAAGGAESKPPTWTRPAKGGSGGSAGTKPAGSNSTRLAPTEEFVDENERADRPQFGVGGLVIVPSGSNAKPNPPADRGDIEPEDQPARPPLNSGDPLTEARANERIKKQFVEEMVLEGQWQDEHGADFVKRHGPRPIDAEGAASWDKARQREIQSWGRQRKLEELRRQRKQ